MPVSLIDEYLAWSPGSKIELVNGQLIVGDSLIHSRLLLSQILRGWGVEAVVALAPEFLWWEALSHTFAAPTVFNLNELDAAAMRHWATQITFENYIYWCLEAKFEFVDGRPDIGGRQGIKGLTGMLLMTRKLPHSCGIITTSIALQ